MKNREREREWFSMLFLPFIHIIVATTPSHCLVKRNVDMGVDWTRSVS